MKKLLFFILAISLQTTSYADEGFSTLQERMTGNEFNQAGLEKLTDAELKALNEWLRRHSVATLESVSASASGTPATTGNASSKDMRGFSDQPKGSKEDDVINSTIVGTFNGWNAKGTLFKLANGMIWQQVEKDSFSTTPVENPQVTIERGFMNKWHLSVVGHKSKVAVKRIQ